jgi:hypothetical protein
MADLTAEEIAELRRLDAATIAQGWTLGQQRPIVIPRENADFLIAAKNYVTRLLDEVERRRVAQSVGGECPHAGEHAPYCSGCCAKFNPEQRLLLHEKDCIFRKHERATD